MIRVAHIAVGHRQGTLPDKCLWPTFLLTTNIAQYIITFSQPLFIFLPQTVFSSVTTGQLSRINIKAQNCEMLKKHNTHYNTKYLKHHSKDCLLIASMIFCFFFINAVILFKTFNFFQLLYFLYKWIPISGVCFQMRWMWTEKDRYLRVFLFSWFF